MYLRRERESERERERVRVLKSVDFPVQTESIADGDAAVFIPNIQPQLPSASTSHTVDGKMNIYSSKSESVKVNLQLKRNAGMVLSLTVLSSNS